jgi:hypothetical protein
MLWRISQLARGMSLAVPAVAEDGMRDFWIMAVASAAFSGVVAWTSPAYPVARASTAPVRGPVQLHPLFPLHQSLRGALRAQEQRLISGCEFESIRTHLLKISEEAGDAIRLLQEFHRQSRFRSGGLAMSEILIDRFSVLQEEADRDATLAETLDMLRQLALGGSHDARKKIGEIVASHPAPPSCLTRELDERLGASRGGASVRRDRPTVR